MDGNLLRIETWTNGELRGAYKEFDKQGKITKQGGNCNGKFCGKSFVYADDNSVTQTIKYRAGKVVEPKAKEDLWYNKFLNKIKSIGKKNKKTEDLSETKTEKKNKRKKEDVSPQNKASEDVAPESEPTPKSHTAKPKHTKSKPAENSNDNTDK